MHTQEVPVLAVNPGSTSTKVALYRAGICVWSDVCRHSPEDMRGIGEIFDQYSLRVASVKNALARHGTKIATIGVAIAPGGLLPPTARTHIHAGAYRISEELLFALKDHPVNPHPVNLGPWICAELCKESGGVALAYDCTTIDEMDPVLKITGFPPIEREARGHNLNMRMMALKFCTREQLDYARQNLIIAHMGGGSTVALHRAGQIADIVSDDICHFSATRCGGIPAYNLACYAIQSGLPADTLRATLMRQSGLMGHLGTVDIPEIERRINAGDEKAHMILDAMCIGISKSIAQLAAVVCGNVDHILLTGGIAHSKMVVDGITKRVAFLAPIEVMAGENEMLGLALGAWRVLAGREPIREYVV